MKEDWFCYVNGILSNVGALDYVLNPGDVEHWDFHDWSFQTFVPAIIGDFPEPFLSGYGGDVRPTIIAYTDDLGEEAEDLKSTFVRLGVDEVGIKKTGQLSQSDKESNNLLILGTIDGELLRELNQIWRRLGFFAHFKDGSIVTLNLSGKAVAEYGAGAGLIQATQSPWNPNGLGACENVVWMVSGTDETGVKVAADVLTDHYAEFRYGHSAVTAAGQTIKIPQ